MDGVLVDSTRVVERLWVRWAARHGLDSGAVLAVGHGRTTVDTMRDFVPRQLAAVEAAEMDADEVAESVGIVSYEGVQELLAGLDAARWAVVTSASRALARARIEAAGLPLPVVLVTSDDVTRGKPDPEPYLLGASLLGYSSGECLVVEDSPPGIQAARAAGARVLAVTTTHAADQLAGADEVAVAMSEAAARVRRWLR